MVLCAALGFCTEIAAGLLLGAVLSYFPETAAGYQGQMASKLSEGLFSLFVIVIFSPLFEESVFRFLIMGVLELKTGFGIANVIQALIFGIYHMSLIQGIYAFLLGALIGLLKHYSGTVLSCICFHVAFNITGVLVNRYMPVEISRGIRIALLLISLSASAALFIMIRRNRYGVQKA